jgi:hypothetical protein
MLCIFQPLGRGLAVNPIQNPRQEASQMRTQNMSVAERLVSNLDQTNALQAMVRQEVCTVSLLFFLLDCLFCFIYF